jgi:hypothetical protein
MEFFEIKRPIRRIGTNTYIIGDDINNPLVTINENEINAPTFNITSGVFIDGIDISSELKELKTSFITNRYELSEAFEHDENGDVIPVTGAQISDTMWILRNENDLEPRANIWRYNTGPEAFTEDISF